jgi:hypothetical protein
VHMLMAAAVNLICQQMLHNHVGNMEGGRCGPPNGRPQPNFRLTSPHAVRYGCIVPPARILRAVRE